MFLLYLLVGDAAQWTINVPGADTEHHSFWGVANSNNIFFNWWREERERDGEDSKENKLLEAAADVIYNYKDDNDARFKFIILYWNYIMIMHRHGIKQWSEHNTNKTVQGRARTKQQWNG